MFGKDDAGWKEGAGWGSIGHENHSIVFPNFVDKIITNKVDNLGFVEKKNVIINENIMMA